MLTRCKIEAISIVAALIIFLPNVSHGTGPAVLGIPPVETTTEKNCISLIVVDNVSGSVLKQKEADTSFDLAGGMVRLMAALTALDYLKPDDTISIENAPAALPEGARLIRFRRNTAVAVKDVLAAMLVYCADNAALVLSEAVLQITGTVDFAMLMNQKAAELGMANTVYTDPTGLMASGQVTTLTDQLVLARTAFSTEAIDSILRQAEYQVISENSRLPKTMVQHSTIMQPGSAAYDERVSAVARGTLATGSSMLIRAQSGRSDITVILVHSSRRISEVYDAVKELLDAYIGTLDTDLLPYIKEKCAALNTASDLAALPWAVSEEQPMIVSAYEGFVFDALQLRVEPDEATLSGDGAGTMALAATVYYGDIPLTSIAPTAPAVDAQQRPEAEISPEPTENTTPTDGPGVTQAPSGFMESYGWLALALFAGLLAVAVIMIGKKIRAHIH